VGYRPIVAAAIICGLGIVAGGTEVEAVTLVTDARLTLTDFARKTGQDPALFETRYAATGMVVCSGVYSTAQLTVKNDLVTTAAHAFYDTDGNPRGDLSTCSFMVMVEGRQLTIPLDVKSLQVGSRNPYAVSPVHDWAVVRLVQPVDKAQPYGITTLGPVGTAVDMLAHRHRGWAYDGRKAIEGCAIRTESRIERNTPREIAIDCSAGEGASGSAIMLKGQSAMVGIYVGWRSTHPDRPGPFSMTHMNFGVSIEGPFRNAILAAAMEPMVEQGKPSEHAAAKTDVQMH
jgi:V8-like Glu-specific endopeptidase